MFDWDDTIIQGSMSAYYRCYAEAIEQNEIEIDFDIVKSHVRELWGRPHRTVIESIVGKENPQFDKIVLSYEQLLSTPSFSGDLSLIPGAKETLTSLKSRYTLAIATGMNATILKKQLIPSLSMEGIFSSIISSSQLLDLSRGKPYPDMLLKLLKEFSVLPSEAIMVGDGKGDVLMARAAGVVPVVVLTGQLSKEEALELKVEHIIPSIADLPAFIKSL